MLEDKGAVRARLLELIVQHELGQRVESGAPHPSGRPSTFALARAVLDGTGMWLQLDVLYEVLVLLRELVEAGELVEHDPKDEGNPDRVITWSIRRIKA
jgi:hypothetical protein